MELITDNMKKGWKKSVLLLFIAIFCVGFYRLFHRSVAIAHLPKSHQRIKHFSKIPKNTKFAIASNNKNSCVVKKSDIFSQTHFDTIDNYDNKDILFAGCGGFY